MVNNIFQIAHIPEYHSTIEEQKPETKSDHTNNAQTFSQTKDVSFINNLK